MTGVLIAEWGGGGVEGLPPAFKTKGLIADGEGVALSAFTTIVLNGGFIINEFLS